MTIAAVVIPTKNAMPLFREVLDAVVAQKTPWPFEIIVIDSGSGDDTAAYAEGKPFTRVIRIAPETFGHGRTRNQAIAVTKAPFVSLLTHDAKPLDDQWLVNIVNAVASDDRIAGAFGRHVAYPHASPFTKRDLELHFRGFLNHPLIVDRETDFDRYQTDIGWRQFLHFFSDNNSCLRRSVWEQIPYPDVEFAEDQIWANRVIDAGYAKAYAPDAVVYHSHDYGLLERLQRSYDEANAFRELFGYTLCETLPQAMKTVAALNVRDFSYAWSSGLFRQRPVHTTRKMLENVAFVGGLFIGTRGDRIPQWLSERISRDKRLRSARVAT